MALSEFSGIQYNLSIKISSSFRKLVIPDVDAVKNIIIGKNLIYLYFVAMYFLIATPAWEYREKGDIWKGYNIRFIQFSSWTKANKKHNKVFS